MPDTPTMSAGGGMNPGDRPLGPPSPNIIETEIKGELSLYDPTQEKVLVLNGTATDVWLLCDGEHTGHQIVDLVARVHGQDPAAVRPEIESTIRHFLDEGFLPKP